VSTVALDAAGGLREQGQAIGALVLHVGVREVTADVAERGGAEQRVGDRMAERVGESELAATESDSAHGRPARIS